MTLTREQVDGWRAAGATGGCVFAIAGENLVALCDLALRALPLPEGEVRELVTQARKAAEILANDGEDELVKRTSKYPGDFIRELTDTLSRQAASLAKFETDFSSEDFAHTAGLLRSDSEVVRSAAASNNHNIILAALDALAGRRG